MMFPRTTRAVFGGVLPYSASVIAAAGSVIRQESEMAKMTIADSGGRTHCKHGHLWTPENLVVAKGYLECKECRAIQLGRVRAKRRSNPRMPQTSHCERGHSHQPENLTFHNGAMVCRACRTIEATHARRVGGISRKTAERVVALLHEGQTLGQLTTGYVGNYKVSETIVDRKRLKNFRNANPKFDKLVMKLSSANARRRFLAGVQARRESAPSAIKNHSEDVLAAIERAVQSLPFDIREDVMNDMVVECWSGRLKPADIDNRIHEYRQAHNKKHTKFAPGGKEFKSLSTPVFEDGSTTLVDTVTEGMWSP